MYFHFYTCFTFLLLIWDLTIRTSWKFCFFGALSFFAKLHQSFALFSKHNVYCDIKSIFLKCFGHSEMHSNSNYSKDAPDLSLLMCLPQRGTEGKWMSLNIISLKGLHKCQIRLRISNPTCAVFSKN